VEAQHGVSGEEFEVSITGCHPRESGDPFIREFFA
jgi:hypothetical protein